MKYFSLSTVKKAYDSISLTTKDKFWGILGIFYSIDSLVKPNLNYAIDTPKLSNFLENIFRFKNKKSYDEYDSSYSVVFANNWESKVSEYFLIGRPNLLPIIVWAYRNTVFEYKYTVEDLLEKFVNDFHLSKENIENLFNISRSDFELEYVDFLYDDSILLKNLGVVSSDATTLKMNKSFVVANAGDLSRGPFFQPLYASLNTIECLIIFPFKNTDYYHLFTPFLLDVDVNNQTSIEDEYIEFLKITQPRSVSNYSSSSFGRIGRILKTIFGVDKDVSIYSYTTVEAVKQIIDILQSNKEFLEYNETGRRQYSNALDWYVKFLTLRSMFSNIRDMQVKNNQDLSDKPLQQIYYGAPGTGKSHTINEVTKGVSSDFVFRTTFHPDSDYSTFVGAYKPTMREVKNHVSLNLSIDDLATELNVLYNDVNLGKVRGVQKFCVDYHMYMDGEYMTVNVKELLRRAGVPEDYSAEIPKYLKFYKLLPKVEDEKIVYSFVPQTFLKAYVKAWQNQDKSVYLVIEEINRGNCAQIFGDLFQLLDRTEDGVSEYPIKADQDIKYYLVKAFADCVGLPENIKSGDELQLPSNLYIWATMNTSDQSLFPIDSAFKRRWDWEYMPIKYKNTDWIINIKNNSYSWASFQSKVNAKILDATNSEDKMLGDYFVNPHDGIITEKMLLNKILFYLWNDVCKDGEGDIFKISDTETVTFSELHGEGGSEKLIKMMEALGVAEFIYETDSNETTDPGRRSKPIPKYLIDGGEVQYTTPKAVQKIVQDFATQHTEMSVDDMINFWNEISERKSFLVASWEPSPRDNQSFANKRRFKVEWGDKTVWGINGWTEELFQMFIRNVNNKLNIAIEKVEE